MEFSDSSVWKNGLSWTLPIDYRKLNVVTQCNVHPLPRIDDSLEAL